MNTHFFRWPAHQAMLSALALITLGAAAPQVQAQAAAATLADRSTATALPYRSVFSGYQTFSDESVAPWTQTNTTVEKIGGWRVYAKEARQPDADDKASPSNATPHSGAHGTHGGKP